jgi:Flp pilus assembly protein TadD
MPSRVITNHHLIELERKAFELRTAGRLKEAADTLSAIVRERPDWEHGAAMYSLANCYEDLGDLEQAESRYREALRYGPKSPIFLGGYASFLYVHGEARRAFASFLELLIVERLNRNQAGVQNAMVALQTLGRKIGLSAQDVSARITAALFHASE